MSEQLGTGGLILNEPLLWHKGGTGRIGMSIPASDVPSADIALELTNDGVDFPDLGEVDVVRHYTRLSQWNFGVDTGMYPLGSCTMKYNPKTNERQAATPELAGAHPMLPEGRRLVDGQVHRPGDGVGSAARMDEPRCDGQVLAGHAFLLRWSSRDKKRDPRRGSLRRGV